VLKNTNRYDVTHFHRFDTAMLPWRYLGDLW